MYPFITPGGWRIIGRTEEQLFDAQRQPREPAGNGGTASAVCGRMTIVVQSPGMQTTVQDLGRPGYGALGVSASGAADPVALRIGNRIVGNRTARRHSN